MMNKYTHTGTDTLTVREYIVDYILPIYCQSLITYKNMRRILEDSVLCDIGDIPADKLSIAQIAHAVEAMKNNKTDNENHYEHSCRGIYFGRWQ